TDPLAVHYHVVDNPCDSDCESAIVRSSLQLSAPATSRGLQDATSPQLVGQRAAETRRRNSRYRSRRNKIGLLLVFAALLLFAGLVICANTKEYFAGATISVIGVILGSSSMVFCLLMTDSCGRVHGYRTRGWSHSQTRRTANANRSGDNRPTPPRQSEGVSMTLMNAAPDGHQTFPTASVANMSGDFLDHLPPPSYETSEILRLEHPSVSVGVDERGAVGVVNDYQYYKVSQPDGDQSTSASPSPSPAVMGATAGHMCEECVQRQQSMEASGSVPREEQLLLAPAIVVELPTYDEAIAESAGGGECEEGE
ncbi:uncharacterized protein, partial [Diadema antillarum]|uniref:uncharacterized protein n=2 Tax=Diadema antillarum TaxID=105358 RepID=UPI003A86B888